MTSVIFIGSPEKNTNSLKKLLFVQATDLMFRIHASFVPPIFKKYRKVHVDFLGPILGLLLLSALVNYGYSFKTDEKTISPSSLIILYIVLLPILCVVLCRFAHASIKISEILALLGYALYGHILTLTLSFIFFHDDSNAIFFVCLIFFGGLSTLRVILVLLATIKVPAGRLIVCSVISTLNILSIIIFHFEYMHRTFKRPM